MNDDLAARFADEAHAHLSVVTELLLRIEHAPDGATLSELQRHLHSVKGAASAIGLQAGVRLAHALEDVLAECSAGRVPLTSETTDTLLEAADTLAGTLRAPEDNAPPPEISSALAALERLLPRAATVGVISPDFADVLSVYQVSRIRQAFERAMRIFEVAIDVPPGGFAEVSGRCEDAARGFPVIARTAGANVPADCDAVYLMLVAAPAGQPAPADTFRELRARIREVAPYQQLAQEVMTPAASTTDLDTDLQALRAVFLSRGAEQVAQMAQELVHLETEAHPQEALDQVFRIVHNLKGGGATFGLTSVTTVAHAMEEILDRLRSDGAAVPPDRISALLQGADALQRLLHEIDAQRADRVTAEALRALRGSAAADVSPSPAPILGADKGDMRPRAAADSVRVPLARLNELVNAVSELQGGQATLEQHCRDVEQMRDELRKSRSVFDARLPAAPDTSSRAAGSLPALEERLRVLDEALAALVLRTNRTLEALQNTVLRVRMVPARRLFAVAPRLVRDLARAQSKQVHLVIEGEDVEVDKQILEELEDPLVHLLRNAIDHGIETPARREASGKPAAGTVRLAATQSGARVQITIRDDGAGIDPAQIRDLAVARGVIDAAQAAALDDAGALRLILHPGFSSRDGVSELSGRGVGLDVVARNIERLQGEVQIESITGAGVTFTIAVPLTLALSTVLYVEAAGQTVALPLRDVQAARLVRPGDLRLVGTRTVLRVEGGVIDAVPLAVLLGGGSRGDSARDVPSAGGVALIVSSIGGRQALLADRIYEGERVVIKALGDLVGSLPVIRGATIRADGEPVVVLDGGALAAAGRSTSWHPAELSPPAALARTVMIVDDSPATIELLSGILRAAGYIVAAALSGDAALAQLEQVRPHAIIADVQMPGIDGFELTRRIRAAPQWRDIPVVILSSLSSDADRRRGLEAGADAYAVKGAFDANSLLSHVDRLVAAGPRS